MLKFAGFTDDGGLAITLRLRRIDPQSLDTTLTKQPTQGFTDLDQIIERIRILPGVRVGDHCNGQRLASGRIDTLSHFAMRLLDADQQFSDV